MVDVLIIGSGLSGLASAYHLTQAGKQVVVVEKESAVGGRARTISLAGMECERAAQFLCQFYTRTNALIARLGIADQKVLIQAPNGIVTNDRANALQPWPFLLGGLLPFWSKLRLLRLGWDVWRTRSLLDVEAILKSEPLDTETVSTYAQKSLDKAILNNFLRPAIRGFWFWQVDSTTKAMMFIFLKHILNPGLFTLKGGMGQLADALAAQVNVQLNTAVQESVYDSMLGEWKTAVDTPQGRQTISSKSVLCTIPATGINQIFPDLPAPAREFFGGITYTTDTPTHLFLNKRFHVSSFYQLFYPPAGSHQIAGITIRSNKMPAQTPPGKDVISIYPSNEFSRHNAGKSDEEIVDLLLTQLDTLYPFTRIDFRPALIGTCVVRLQQALPVFNVGAIHKLKHFCDVIAPTFPPGLHFAGDFIGGPSLEQTIVAGEQASQKLLAFLH